MKYRFQLGGVLTASHYLAAGQCQGVSLTGAVSSQTVTEEFEGTLSTVSNRASSARVEVCLTARQTCRAVTKVGVSDQVVVNGNAIA